MQSIKLTNKGITLIALVITIIVSLILVAVTVTMAVNGGLFGHAGKAAGDTQDARDAEQRLANSRVKIGEVWYDSFDDYLAANPSTNQETEEGIILEPGLYDENNILIADWNTLVNTYGLDVTADYTSSTYNTDEHSVDKVLSETELLEGKKLVIGNEITKIGEYAFYMNSKLTNIIMPNSLISIGNYAFYICSELTSIEIPMSVVSIGESHVFYGCGSLEEITVAPENTVYDSRNNCNAIINTSTNELILGCKNTVILNSVISIGTGAFSKCTELTSITIPDSITSIGGSAFSGCSSLTNITMPDSIISIGASAFNGCSSLTSIRIPDGVTSIGMSTFSGCSRLTSITIPDSITSIGMSAFSGCSSLASVKIPDGVKSIPTNVFKGCTSLKDIYIPSSVTSILTLGSATAPFNSCSSNLKIYCGANSKPTLWGSYWNNYSSSGKLTVNYGYTRAQYEQAISNTE